MFVFLGNDSCHNRFHRKLTSEKINIIRHTPGYYGTYIHLLNYLQNDSDVDETILKSQWKIAQKGRGGGGNLKPKIRKMMPFVLKIYLPKMQKNQMFPHKMGHLRANLNGD